MKSLSFLTLFFSFAIASFAQIQLSGLDLSKTHINEPVSIAIARNSPDSKDSLFITLTLQMEEHVHIYSAESLFFKVAILKNDGLGDALIRLPEPKPFTNFDKTVTSVFVNGQKIIIKLPMVSPDWSLGGTVQSQACDSHMCYTPRKIAFTATSKGDLSAAPEAAAASSMAVLSGTTPAEAMKLLDDFKVIGSTGGFLNAAKFSDFLIDPSGNKNNKTGGFEGKGVLLIILLILIGGIALNLTPCVLPMLPITIAILGAGAQAKSHGRGMFIGAVYGLSMALTYGLLGLVVVLTGAQFGVINSSPVFNIVISLVFLVMSLAMFDIIQVDFTRFRKGGNPQEKQGKVLTVFFMGIVASILAGACVAPVVISVVLYSGSLYAKGDLVGLFLPFLLGVGMALPWPFAAAGLSFLPKPGKWMVWVKYVFGVLILGMALYYGYLGVNLFWTHNASNAQDLAGTVKSRESDLPWTHSLGEGLQKARNENKPVFIDFWASWCKNCTAMEATTFRDPEVRKLLTKFVLVKYQAEKPEEPATKRLLDRFGVVGLPTYVVLAPK
jgi:thioredoxin:protein disulfide reductase